MPESDLAASRPQRAGNSEQAAGCRAAEGDAARRSLQPALPSLALLLKKNGTTQARDQPLTGVASGVEWSPSREGFRHSIPATAPDAGRSGTGAPWICNATF